MSWAVGGAAQRLETQMRAAPHALTALLGPGSPISVETQVFLVSWALNLDLSEEERSVWLAEVWKWRAHLSDYDIRLGRTILHHLSSFELRHGGLQ